MEEVKTQIIVHPWMQDPALSQLPEWKVRRRKRLSLKTHKTRARLKAQVVAHYGGKCYYCHTTDLRVLCIDHIADDGAEHRRELGFKGASTYKWLKRHGYPPGFQVLCANHNWEKELDRRREAEKSEVEGTVAARKSKELARLETLQHYSNGEPRCAECGESNIGLLTFYSPNRISQKDMGQKLVNWLRNNNYPEGFTVLCLNCDMKKRITD